MNNIGALIGMEHELDRRLGKEDEPLGVVRIPVQAFPTEEVGRRMRLDEKALPPVCVAEPYRAPDRASIPRHPQVVMARRQIPDLRVPQAPVLRQDDLDWVSADL